MGKKHNTPQETRIAPDRGFTGSPIEVGGMSNVNPNEFWKEPDGKLETLAKGVANVIPSAAFTLSESLGQVGGALWDMTKRPLLYTSMMGTGFTQFLGSSAGRGAYDNPLVSWSQKAAEDYTFDIERKNPDKAWDPGDFGWWVEGGSSLASSVIGFGAAGAGVGSTFARLAKAFTKAGANPKLMKASAQLMTSASLAYAEGAMSGNSVYKSVYEKQLEKALDEGMDFDQANIQATTIAANAADTTVGLNTAINTLLNITSVAPIFKRLRYDKFFSSGEGARKAGESLSDWKTRISGMSEFDDAVARAYKTSPENILKRGGKYALEAGQESLEELVNVFSESTGEQIGKDGHLDTDFLGDDLGQLKKFFDRTMNEEGAAAAFWGALGGVGNTFVMDRIPMHKDYKRSSDGSYIPKKDEEGNPTGEYETAWVSSRFLERNQNPRLFHNAKQSVIADVDFMQSRMNRMRQAKQENKVEEYEAARREIVSAHTLNAVFRGEAANFENSLDDWTKLDNQQDLSVPIKERIDELTETAKQLEANNDLEALAATQQEIKELSAEAKKLEGQTEATMAGVADAMGDMSYLEDIENFKKDLRKYDELFNSIRKSVYGLADESIELEAARRMLMNHIEANLLRRDVNNLDKSAQQLEASLVDPDADVTELTALSNRAYNTYIHDYRTAQDYSKALERVSSGDKAYTDYWSAALGLKHDDQEGIITSLENLLSDKNKRLKDFSDEIEARMGEEFTTLEDYLEEQFKNASNNEALIKTLRAREDRKVRLEAVEHNIEKLTPKKAVREVASSVEEARNKTMDDVKFMQSLSRKTLMDKVQHVENFVKRAEFVIETTSLEIESLTQQLDNTTDIDQQKAIKLRIQAKELVKKHFTENLVEDKRSLVSLINDMSPAEADDAADRYFSLSSRMRRLARKFFKVRKNRTVVPVGESSEEAGAYARPGMSDDISDKFSKLMNHIETSDVYGKLTAKLSSDNVLVNAEQFQVILNTWMSQFDLSHDDLPANYLEEAYNRLLEKSMIAITGEAKHAAMLPVQTSFIGYVDKLSDVDFSVVKSVWPLFEVIGTYPDFNSLMDLKQEVKEGNVSSDLYARIELAYNDLKAIDQKFDNLGEVITQAPTPEPQEALAPEAAPEELPELNAVRFNEVVGQLSKAFPNADVFSDTKRLNKQLLENDIDKVSFLYASADNAHLTDQNIKAYNRAVRLSKLGLPNIVVRKLTGWFKGLDKRWKFEIDDTDMSFVMPAEDMEYYAQMGSRSGNHRVVALKDVIEHDELFEKYPKLAELNVLFYEQDSDTQGYYSPTKNTIGINTKSLYENSGGIDAGSINNRRIKGTLVHEIQHAIQKISEDTAVSDGQKMGGANPDTIFRRLQRGRGKSSDDKGALTVYLTSGEVLDYSQFSDDQLRKLAAELYLSHYGEIEARAAEGTGLNQELGVFDGVYWVEYHNDPKIVLRRAGKLDFLKTPKGTIYGATFPDGSIYLNGEVLSRNAAVHEFGHLWVDQIKKHNPELYKKGISLIKNTQHYKNVDSNPSYRTLSESRLLEEALVTAIGDRGEAVTENGFDEKFKAWLKQLKEWLTGTFFAQRKEHIDSLTLDEFLDGAVHDLLSGREVVFDLEESTDSEEEGDIFGGNQTSMFEVTTFLGSAVDDINVENYTHPDQIKADLKMLETLRKKIQGKSRSNDPNIAAVAQQDLDTIKQLKEMLKAEQKRLESLSLDDEPVGNYDSVREVKGQRVISGTTIAHYHIEVEERVEDGVLYRDQTGDLNRKAFLDVLKPGVLEAGTRLVAVPVTDYEGGMYQEYGGEYTAEQVHKVYTDIDGNILPEYIEEVPIKLVVEGTDKTVGYLHARGWLMDSIGGNGFDIQYRNVDVLENYPDPDQQKEKLDLGLRSINELEEDLMRLRERVVKNHNNRNMESVVLNVQSKGVGHLIEYRGEEELSAKDLFPDNTVKVIISEDERTRGLAYLEVPSATKDQNLNVPLRMNRVSLEDARTLYEVVKSYAIHFSDGVTNEQTRAATDKLKQIKELTGYNVVDSLGLKKFIHQYYFQPLAFDVNDLNSRSEGFYLDVKTSSDEESRGQLYMGIPGKFNTPVELFDANNELNPEFLNNFIDGVLVRRYGVTHNNKFGYNLEPKKADKAKKARGGQLDVVGINTEQSLATVKFNEELGIFERGEEYGSYNEMAKANATVDYDGRHKVGGQYVYTIHPTVEVVPTNSTSELEVLAEEAIETPVETEVTEDTTTEDFEDWILDDEAATWDADSVRVDPVKVRRKLEALSESTEEHNGISVDEAYSSLLRAGQFDLPRGVNPFRACRL